MIADDKVKLLIGGHKALIGYSLEPGYDPFRPPSGSKIDLGFVLYVEEVFKVSMMKASF